MWGEPESGRVWIRSECWRIRIERSTIGWNQIRVKLKLVEFFLNCQIWHFCHSCTKLTSQGFRISKKKIASTGYWTHNTNPTLRFPAPLTTQPPRHLLNRRFMNWKFEAGMDWQIGWVGKGAGILIVGLVLWVQYPVEAIFFLLILKPCDVNFVQEWQKCQIWQLRKNSTKSDIYVYY